MAVVADSGTATSNGSEQTLATVTDNRAYLLVVSRANQGAGDTLTLKAKVKIDANDITQTFEAGRWIGAPTDTPGNETKVALNVLVSPGVEAVFTLTATTGDDYDWWLLEV